MPDTETMPRFKPIARMAEHFALDSQGRVVLGCVDCDYTEAAMHVCTSECSPHERLERPTPIPLLPHGEHQ